MMRRRVTAEPYDFGLIRLRVLDEGVEITVTHGEVAAVNEWARVRVGRTRFGTLPVPEFVDPRWTTQYRWSFAADAVYRSALRTERAA